jgi:predicted RNA-binding protein with RPS1 domain
MVLEGVVTNVAAFGAFVDVGVHHDGLVHISAMANAFVKDPRKIAKPGDVVRVKVLEVDPKRRRISLTMRLDEAQGAGPSTTRTEIAATGSEKRLRPAEARAGRNNSVPASGDAMAEAFRRAGLTGKTPGHNSAAGLRAPDTGQNASHRSLSLSEPRAHPGETEINPAHRVTNRITQKEGIPRPVVDWLNRPAVKPAAAQAWRSRVEGHKNLTLNFIDTVSSFDQAEDRKFHRSNPEQRGLALKRESACAIQPRRTP